MKIALFNDLPVQPGFGSGAELSSLAFMREGTRREHVVDCYTPQTTNRGFDSYDLAVIKNVTAFSEVQLDEILKVPTVHWPSDYLMCKWRLFYAMQEKCKKCEGADKAGDIISQSILNVFLSPLHKAAYEFVFPEIKTSGLNTHLSPPFVDPDVFKPIEGVPREENTAIGVNALLDFKGGENVLAYAEEHPEIVFNMFGGPSNNPVLPDNLLYIGRALQEALPALYSQASHYIEIGIAHV